VIKIPKNERRWPAWVLGSWQASVDQILAVLVGAVVQRRSLVEKLRGNSGHARSHGQRQGVEHVILWIRAVADALSW